MLLISPPPAPPPPYTLSLHDALPISPRRRPLYGRPERAGAGVRAHGAQPARAWGAARSGCRGGEEDAGGARRLGIHSSQHRSEEHTSELQSRRDLVCRLLLEKKKKQR